MGAHSFRHSNPRSPGVSQVFRDHLEQASLKRFGKHLLFCRFSQTKDETQPAPAAGANIDRLFIQSNYSFD